MVAQGIILVSLLSLAYTATIGFTDIALARQRQGANGLANRLIEQVRALPFQHIQTGLSTTDSTVVAGGDSGKILGSGCGTGNLCYRPTTTAPLERIARGNNPASVPLNPHRATTTVGVTPYTRYVYITVVNNDLTLNAYRITVVVEWTPPHRGAVRASVQAQTIAYSPQGCTSTATHPFAAPCQPFIYSGAQLPAASIQVIPEPNQSFTGGIRGLDLEKASIYSVGQSANAQAEQVTAVAGRALTSGIDLKRIGVSATPSGQQVVLSTADNDPSQPGGEHDDLSSVLGSGGTTLSLVDDDLFAVSHTAGDTISAMGTMNAGTSHPCGGQTDDLACARTTGTGNSLNRVRLQVDQGGVDLEDAVIAQMSGSAIASSALVHRDLPTGLDGSMGVQLTRSLPNVLLGGLPTDFAGPTGWNTALGLVSVSGYSATLEAQAGESTSALPLSGAVTAGTVQFWNGTGYTTIPTSTLTSTVQTSFPVAFDVTRIIDGKDVRVVMDGNFLAGGLTISSTGTSTNRTQAEVRALPALAGSMIYRIFIGPNTDSEQLQAALTFNVDLGTQIASASYSTAPGG